MLKKLRFQLTAWYSLGILTTIVFLLIFFYWATNKVFYQQVDATLNEHVRAVATSVEQGAKQAGCNCLSNQSSFLDGILQMPGMPTAIFDENNQMVKSSADFNNNPLLFQKAFVPPLYFNEHLSNQTYRFLLYPVKTNDKQIGSVLMGHPIETFLKTRQILAQMIILIILVIFIPAIALARLLAERALSRQKEFLTEAAHSLKTPLAVIQSQIESQPEKFDRTALLTNLQRLSQAVNQTLESAYSQTPLSESAIVNLNALLAELVEISQHLGQKKHIKVTLSLTREQIFVSGNKQKLAKAILSVMENAINYGKTNGQVKVSLATGQGQAIIMITDNGTGITEKDLPLVFNRSYRGQNARIKGNGLGLFITKNIIEELGGQIALKSQLGQGTTVTISLLTLS
ncbi:MAG: HAMP domain-containing histidine kinase [Patescibacteria group bacterium]|nr:HAMP domain-containing histidine kinase [Patescibacteria group bacterium]MCL5095707.1 HAMP domain-containing histidine kinase [Patescibacteria group bacterium]